MTSEESGHVYQRRHQVGILPDYLSIVITRIIRLFFKARWSEGPTAYINIKQRILQFDRAYELNCLCSLRGHFPSHILPICKKILQYQRLINQFGDKSNDNMTLTRMVSYIKVDVLF